MQNMALASIASEIGGRIGDTSTTFLAKIKLYLNDRYDNALMRSQATAWTIASTAALADGGIPTLGLGKVIREGATADAYDAKRQFKKAAKFEKKYEYELANYIISGDSNLLNASFSRYGYHT